MQLHTSSNGGARRPQDAPAPNGATNGQAQAGVAPSTSNGGDNNGNRVAFVGNYLPRRCGIATFTTDLCTALAGQSAECFAVAMNDRSERYDYPPPVRFTVEQNDLACYRRAAQFLNNRVDVVSLQHEYGIYGGPAGSHILTVLAELRARVVTTLHTVLREPSVEQRKVLEHVGRLSDRVVVMSRRGAEFLQDVYRIPAEKIDFIPHGTPDFGFVDPSFHKDKFGVAGKSVLMTFGLLAPGKGLESVIQALPAIIARFPDVVYLVVGVTHPHVLHQQGETYRMGLRRLARDLGVEKHVIFHNRFVDQQELIEFLGAADIYVSPYQHEAQITSGTLAWAVGAGKAVVSTPYWYAQELLADERGVLVPFNDPGAIAEAVNHLLENEVQRNAMRKRAYLFAREMIWPNVARAYLDSFARAREQRAQHSGPRRAYAPQPHVSDLLPETRLQHLKRLTDGTGILQHARFAVPNYHEGHTTDDNARALVLMALLDELGELPADEIEDLTTRYLAFVAYAFNPGVRRFRNFLAYEPRHWPEEIGSDDCHGRALCGLGVLVGRTNRPGLRGMAVDLFNAALPAALELSSPRAWAYTLLGIHDYLRWLAGDRAAEEAGWKLADRLLTRFHESQREGWTWFEDSLTYANACLPQALLAAGECLGQSECTEIGLVTLEWLTGVQRAPAGHFVSVGSNGFYTRGGACARFDQQPIEACVSVSACLTAFRITGDLRWHREAERAFEWFLGRNDLGLPLCDLRTGACHDGLCPDQVNANEGAESTLAYLLALAEMRLAAQTSVLSGGANATAETSSRAQEGSHVGQPA
jgi:glycosyltransferase involved in cell wall biosynthesis